MIREKRHRLPPEAYRGNVVCAFTICTSQRESFFTDETIIQIARVALAEAFAHYRGHAGVYLFMPDHVHLMVSGKETHGGLLAMVGQFKQKTTFRVRAAGKPFAWEKDFYDHIVRASEDYGAQVRYLLRNPGRKGWCRHWEEWPHKGVLGQTWEQLALNIGTL